MVVCWCHLPVFVFHHPKPLDQVLGALQSGVQAVFLTFETGHILHGHTEQQKRKERKKKGALRWGEREREGENTCVLNHNPQTEHYLHTVLLLGSYIAFGQFFHVIMKCQIILL